MPDLAGKSMNANKKLVKQWDDTHAEVKIKSVQGSRDTDDDQPLTSPKTMRHR
ncbi:hypothetical protein [Streptomyces sp. NPDC046939]|uniref:hypothetical protein n=1 Tax=Streptomyces sp. NPDC046939 TaxID=3155376 RepID=UPI0033F2DE04